MTSWTLTAEQSFGKTLSIKRFSMESGMKLILLRDPSAPIFSYQTWYSVGSRHEKKGQTGMAHLFEHLMFSQTKTTNHGDFDKLIEHAGGDSNAATWTDWTFYRTSLPSNEMKLAVGLESDRMQNLLLQDQLIESEREVVINERELRVDNDIDGFLEEQLMKEAFRTHTYHHPTIGWMNDIKTISKYDMEHFYRTYYAPNNATVVIVGAIDETKTLDLISEYYGTIPATTLPKEHCQPEDIQTSERISQFTKPIAADHCFIGYKAPPQTHTDWIILDLIARLLTDGSSSWLYRDLVIDNELVSSIDAGVLPFHHPGLFQISIAMNRNQHRDKALLSITNAIEKLQNDTINVQELSKIKQGSELAFHNAFTTFDDRAEMLGHYETVLGDFASAFTIAKTIQSITAQDIQQVAQQYLIPQQRTVVIATPA